MRVFFVGGASLARLCHNILKKEGHEVPLIYDRTKGLAPPWDFVVFDDETAIPMHARTCEAFLVCIGDVHGEARVRYSRQLRRLGLKAISAIHPVAVFGEGAILGEGIQAMPGSVVNDYATIGDFCIINSTITNASWALVCMSWAAPRLPGAYAWETARASEPAPACCLALRSAGIA